MNDNIIEVDLKVTNQDIAVMLEVLDKSIQGRQMAKLVVPVMDKLESQLVQGLEKVADERKEARKKIEAAQKEAAKKEPTEKPNEPTNANNGAEPIPSSVET